MDSCIGVNMPVIMFWIMFPTMASCSESLNFCDMCLQCFPQLFLGFFVFTLFKPNWEDLAMILGWQEMIGRCGSKSDWKSMIIMIKRNEYEVNSMY